MDQKVFWWLGIKKSCRQQKSSAAALRRSRLLQRFSRALRRRRPFQRSGWFFLRRRRLRLLCPLLRLGRLLQRRRFLRHLFNASSPSSYIYTDTVTLEHSGCHRYIGRQPIYVATVKHSGCDRYNGIQPQCSKNHLLKVFFSQICGR